MADPNPLLPQAGSEEPEAAAPLPEGKRQCPSLDDTIEHCVGDFGWTQVLQITLVSFAWFFDAQQIFISIFTDAEPKWSCINSNFSSSCNGNSNPCQLPRESWSWDFPASTSIISEWSLECAGSIITGLPESAFFSGSLVGGFALASLSDSALGRKNMLVLSILLVSLTGVLTALSTNVWMYAGLRFVAGFCRASIGACALVLATELVKKKWRENVGIIGFICFTLGFLALPLISFLLQGYSWRLIYLWTCVPAIFYAIAVFFAVRESPRWLFIKGRKDEFAETLRSIAAPASRSTLTQSFFGRCSAWEEKKQETDIFSALNILMTKGWSCRRLVAVMVVGFGHGVIYYGMPLGLGNLSFNLYLSVTLNALSEFPASLLAFILIAKLSRKGSVLGLSLLSGLCSVCCVLVRWKALQIVLELMSYLSACTAFDIVSIYTLELFPTCVRNSAVAMARQSLVLGGALGSVLAAVGRKKGLLLSYGVFGVIILICTLFVVCLPETKGRVLCDTMEEEERKNAAFDEICRV